MPIFSVSCNGTNQHVCVYIYIYIYIYKFLVGIDRYIKPLERLLD